MNPHEIFHPMAALAALTLVVVTAVGVVRVRAVARREISENFYRLFEGGERPELEAKLTRHYANLLEWPVLFYVVGISIFAADRVDSTFVTMFWAFVAIRFVHAVVHIGWNRPPYRAGIFGVGVLLLTAIWVRFLALL